MKKNIFIVFIAFVLLLCSCTPSEDPKDNPNVDPIEETNGPYKVTFKDENGTVLSEKEYEKDSTPSYSYNVTDTDEWDYTFNGWSLNLNGNVLTSLPSVTKDIAFYASVSKVKKEYNVSFYNELNELISTKKYKYGETPSENYEKADTNEWNYTLEGWSTSLNGEKLNTIPTVSKDASYYALISKEVRKFKIAFNSNEGSSLSDIEDVYNSSVNEPAKPTKEGHAFVCWCSDETLNTKVTWPINLTSDITLYAKWNETVDIKGMLNSLKSSLNQDPYSYIPNSMRPGSTSNLVTQNDITYDFTSFTNVDTINYNGFGEQWHMVIDNIQESQLFYSVLNTTDTIIAAAVTAFNNYFDNNPSDTNKEINETGYYAKVNYKDGILSFTIQFKTGKTIAVFGEVLPQIDMTYDVENNIKTVRINLSDTNALKYTIKEKSYSFGITYGISEASRTAYFQIVKNEDNSIQGNIYEYIQAKGKDLLSSCADFYINDTYVSVIGNKASGIILLDSYINELYTVDDGILQGYKVQETKTVFSIKGTYHTLWFKLSDISGINNIKILEHSNTNTNTLNSNDIYINNSTKLFEPSYNKILTKKTSREYDIEYRKMYFYVSNNDKLECKEVLVPMMFIQDDHGNYTNYSDFVNHIKTTNGVDATVNIKSTSLSKIRSDYNLLIDVFKTNKEQMNSSTIKTWIGDKIK